MKGSVSVDKNPDFKIYDKNEPVYLSKKKVGNYRVRNRSKRRYQSTHRTVDETQKSIERMMDDRTHLFLPNINKSPESGPKEKVQN